MEFPGVFLEGWVRILVFHRSLFRRLFRSAAYGVVDFPSRSCDLVGWLVGWFGLPAGGGVTGTDGALIEEFGWKTCFLAGVWVLFISIRIVEYITRSSCTGKRTRTVLS